jgi:hypothetical protein
MSRLTVSLRLALLILLLLPGTALAGKRLYTAKLSYANELHEVVGSTAVGSMTLATNVDSTLRFQMSVQRLSAAPTNAHIHGPASESENATTIVTLCGNPAPASVPVCPGLNADGTWTLSGDIAGHMVRGMTAGQFYSYLDAGLLYVNVHTALNPAGETRGQLHPR